MLTLSTSLRCCRFGWTSFTPQRSLATIMLSSSTSINHTSRSQVLGFRRTLSNSALQSPVPFRRSASSLAIVTSRASYSVRPITVRWKPSAGQPTAVHYINTRPFTAGSTRYEKVPESLSSRVIIQNLQHKLYQERQRTQYTSFNILIKSVLGALALTALISLLFDPYGRDGGPHATPAEAQRDILARSVYPPEPPWLKLLESLETMLVVWMNLESARLMILFVAQGLAWCCRFVWTFVAGAGR